MNYLIDVNLWVALTVSNHVHHELALAWFDDVPLRSSAFCRVTQMGLLRLLTNATVMGPGALTAAAAWEIYDALLADDRVFFSPEPEGLEGRWRRFLSDQPSSAGRWTDHYLAGFAAAAGMTLVTFDRRFRQLPDLRVLVLAASD
jgi:hypothetical protein